uniref:Uncharacterized protein n=1 Tax=Anopheles culicifacies TaxID=139723 RepID=A0A182MII3_9DIPT
MVSLHATAESSPPITLVHLYTLMPSLRVMISPWELVRIEVLVFVVIRFLFVLVLVASLIVIVRIDSFLLNLIRELQYTLRSSSSATPGRYRLRSTVSSSSPFASSSPLSPLRDSRRRLLCESSCTPSVGSAASPRPAKKLTRFFRSNRSFSTHFVLYLKKASILTIQLSHMFAS